MPRPICEVDYETKEIEARPAYPPEPVGVAIGEPGQRRRYWAWGHPTENNCTKAQAGREIKRVTRKYRCVYHNAKFDIEISEKFFNLPLPNSDRYECTMLLAYLRNPRQVNLKLKELAEYWLGISPKEQTALRDWILKNIPGAKRSPTTWGKYISKAPGKLVGRYACADIKDTGLLYKEFHPYIVDLGMSAAYTREKKITPIIIKMEQRGVPINKRRLAGDLKEAHVNQDKAIKAVYRKLGGEINLGSRPQVVEAFERKGLVKPGDWIRTDPTLLMRQKALDNGEEPIGNERIGIEHLAKVCNSKLIMHNMGLNSKLKKLITTYMKPWLAQAKLHGQFYPWFNQTRGDNDYGTKSGRFSSNFQQTPKKADKSKIGLLLPNMRNYIVADSPKHVILQRDFIQQELRILAYYEKGALYRAYMENPNLDMHDLVGQRILEIARMDLPRGIVKTCNFLLVYGGGILALSIQLGITWDEAQEIVYAHRKAIPGLKKLSDKLIKLGKRGKPFYTIGGREYYAERGKEYVSPNNLFQGGGADHMKAAMIRVDDAFNSELEETRIMITVHDELIVSTPKLLKRKAMRVFQEAMDADTLFKPMLMPSDGKAGKSWGEATPYEGR